MADRLSLRASVLAILSSSAGLSPDNVADAIVTAVCGPVTEADLPASAPLDPTDPAVTGIPRDETHDGIDAATNVLTNEAIQKRADDQVASDAADKQVAADNQAVSDDNAKLAQDTSTLEADTAAQTSAHETLAGDDTVSGADAANTVEAGAGNDILS